MKEKVRKAYIYTRVSTAMQVEGYSLDAQKKTLTDYAKTHNMQIIREYSDEGKSGKSIKGRSEFKNMLKDIETKRDNVDVVLVFKISRFARNALEAFQTVDHIKSCGVQLICTDDPIDTTDPMSTLMLGVLSCVAEVERETILVQTMEGRRQKAREGKWNGGFAPYGYYLENGDLIIDEEEAEAVRTIFDKFVHTDMGYNGVVKYLQKQGIKKKARQNGYLTEFSVSTVKAILDNPVYAGKIAYGRRKSEKIEGTRNDTHIVRQKDFPVYEGKHEAIIDEQLWKDAHEKRRKTARKYEKKHDIEHAYVLSGIVKCPACGAGMYGNPKKYTNKDGNIVVYYSYMCKHRKVLDGHKCDFSGQYTESVVVDAVAEIIKKLVANPRFSEVIKTKIKTKVDTQEAEKELQNAKNILKQLEGTKNKLISQIDNLDVLDRNYERKFDDLQHRLDSIYDKIADSEDDIEDCEQKLENIKRDKITSDNIYNYLLMFDKIYDVMSDSEKKEFFGALLQEVQLYDKKEAGTQVIKSIKFKFPIFYDGEFTDTIFRDKEVTVECVVLMSRKEN